MRGSESGSLNYHSVLVGQDSGVVVRAPVIASDWSSLDANHRVAGSFRTSAGSAAAPRPHALRDPRRCCCNLKPRPDHGLCRSRRQASDLRRPRISVPATPLHLPHRCRCSSCSASHLTAGARVMHHRYRRWQCSAVCCGWPIAQALRNRGARPWAPGRRCSCRAQAPLASQRPRHRLSSADGHARSVPDCTCG